MQKLCIEYIRTASEAVSYALISWIHAKRYWSYNYIINDNQYGKLVMQQMASINFV